MTIGNIENLLDLKNIDPLAIHDLIIQLTDLCKQLVSEMIDTMFDEDSEFFKSNDLVLEGDFSFPRQNRCAFKFDKNFNFAVIFFVSINFEVGYYFGAEFIVGYKVLTKTGFAEVVPFVGGYVKAEIGLGLGFIFIKIGVEGDICEVRFPTSAEIAFKKFPIDVRLSMYLELIPVRVQIYLQISLEVDILFIKIKYDLFKKVLYKYTAPTIRQKIIDLDKKEKDQSPPVISQFVASDQSSQTAVKPGCLVRQLPDLDYTEPQFEISAQASDDIGRLALFLDVGTVPGGSDVLKNQELAGPSTVISDKLNASGQPLYFTVIAENDSGQQSKASCKLPTYDVTLPDGRFDAAFLSTSNPEVLKASLTVYEDSELKDTKVAVGYGKGIHGDQIISWKHVSLEEKTHISQGDDPLNLFTEPQTGKLVAQKGGKDTKEKSVGDCALVCLQMPPTKCMSFNYDFGDGTCEKLEGIEGHTYKMSQSGLYDHYQRLGVGKTKEFVFRSLSMKHGEVHYFNFRIENVLGYKSFLHTKGVVVDLTAPTTGLIKNSSEDVLERVDCRSLIPETDRPDWLLRCRDVNGKIKNHRRIVDGVGSRTVFNGAEPLTDLLFTRANRYITANWDGFADRESGILGYTVFVGQKICEDLIHPHHDPHKHFFEKSQWTHIAMIYPIPEPFTILPDGQYYVTIRALNEVEYGGPLATTVCHTTPYTVDNSPPLIWEIFDINFDEDTFNLTFQHHSGDPHSGLAYNDVCLGRTTRDCKEMSWKRLTFSSFVSYIRDLTNGVPIWVKVRAVNQVDLRAIRVADEAIIVDKTPPYPGVVMDGPLYGIDLMYTKDFDALCSNWLHFYDPESGIGYYMVSAGSEDQINVTDVANLTEYSRSTHEICIPLTPDRYLQHGQTYYTTVWAYNGAVRQRNTVAMSNGVIVDLTKPLSGEVIDGNIAGFTDLQFSGSPARVEVQWRDYYDPESTIRQYDVLVEAASNDTSDFKVIRNWVPFSNDTNSVRWLNFHLHHKDRIKIKLCTTNGALNTIVNETNGFLVDLTPPHLIYLGDGLDIGGDVEFQSDTSNLSSHFKFIDEESGIDHYKVQVYQTHQGVRSQKLPETHSKWFEIKDEPDKRSFVLSNLTLLQGGFYSMRVGALNKAGFVAVFDTNGLTVDTTPPIVHWFHVNTLSDEEQQMVDGFVWQADTSGIKATWYATDHQSGIINFQLAVGTSPGDTDVMYWTDSGTDTDKYIGDLILEITDQVTMSPVYYVSLVAVNGAGLKSSPVISTPIVVVEEDTPGIVIDGSDRTDQQPMSDIGVDLDYQFDQTTVCVQFTGFESHLHGVMSYDWAIGTTPGGEDVRIFSPHGIIHTEETNVAGDGVTSSGYGQANVELKDGRIYYSTIRGVTNAGNVIESISDGFIVDQTSPIISLDMLCDKDDQIESGFSMYKSSADSLSATWHYNDTESSIERAWYSVGTYPYADDIHARTEVQISSTFISHLEVGTVPADITGKPNIISVWLENKAGLIERSSFGSVIIDTSKPGTGYVTCSNYIGLQTPIHCSWSGFLDEESPIKTFTISLGSEQGSSDTFEISVGGYTSRYSINGVNHLLIPSRNYFVTVTAINTVNMETYAFSGPIALDTTPPKIGKVIDLHTTYRIDASNNTATVALNAKICHSDKECERLDATCSESLSSVSVTWQPFTDDESGIVRYQIAVGNTPGGGQIKPFFDVPTDAQYYTVSGLNLKPYRKVYVSIKGTNGAGLSSVGSSNGVSMSYLSQGLPPLSHIGVNDVLENSDIDIDFQESFETYRSSWDMSGDPCPVLKYEWQIQKLGGDILVGWMDMGVETYGLYDGLQLRDGELYYSLVRVTNALNFTYTLRSNGVTVKQDPLIPGKVFDGFITGYDLNFLPSRRKVSANWDGFGLSPSASFQVDVQGNPGLGKDETLLKEQPENQKVLFYEVAVGTDRRFHKTRDNIVPFTNVGQNKSVTFYDLDLQSGTAKYYFTVKAYSASYSIVSVTSNGFHVGFDGGVIAGDIIINDYISTDTFVDVQFEEFTSKVDMLGYYIGISNHAESYVRGCKHFIDGRLSTEEKRRTMFNVAPLININLDTFYTLKPLVLEHNHLYYVWVIGVDESGDCAMTGHSFLVDVTPPLVGRLAPGPFYDMDLAYTSDNETIEVKWKNFYDQESGISSYAISLWSNSSCYSNASETLLVDWIQLTYNYSSYSFVELDLKIDVPYRVRFRAINNAGLDIITESCPVLYDPSVPTPGKVVDGWDFTKEQVWFTSTSTVTGTLLHLASPYGDICPSRHISMTDDKDWRKLQQIGLKDPSGKKWSLFYRKENIDKLVYDDAISVKLARDSKTDQMFSGAYSYPASLENGGTFHISVRPAIGGEFSVTEILFWDGPDNEFATYNYEEEEIDWMFTTCECCLIDPLPVDCNYCNCTSYISWKYGNTPPPPHTTTSSTTTQASVSTTYTYDIVKSPETTEVVEPIDTSIPVAQPSCGLQFLSGQQSKIVMWCRSYNDSFDIQKSEAYYNITDQFYDVKIMFNPEIDDAVDVSWCLSAYIGEEEVTIICGIHSLSKQTKLILHVFNRNNFVPEINDTFNVFSTKAYFKSLIMPPALGTLCRYGDPFRGGTNPIILYEAGIGSDVLQTDIAPFREIIKPCIPCYGECSKYNCDASCKSDVHTKYTFTLKDLDLVPKVSIINETGHYSNKTAIHYITVKAVTGSGISATSSSRGFYIDITPPVFDKDMMLSTPIYIDVLQGQFKPIRYQASNTTIQAFWRCYDDDSLIKENLWAVGLTIGGEELQPFHSVGTNQSALNNTFEGLLETNTTYYVSIRCVNGGGLSSQWNDLFGVTVLLEAPDVAEVNSNVQGAEDFPRPVSPSDAKETSNPTSVGITFTVIDDESVNRYDMCIGTSNDTDNIFPCTWIGYNVSATVMIKDGYLCINDTRVRSLSDLKMQMKNTSSEESVFHMEPGRTMFMTLRICNEAMLCSNKSLGSILITDDKTVLKTSENGEPIKIEHTFLSSSTRSKREVNSLYITTPKELVQGQSLVYQPLDEKDLQTEYRSDASLTFQPYIVNPFDTADMVERLLYKRIQFFVSSFALVPVGHLPMPGPINITYQDFMEENDDNVTVLAHWNPESQQWEISSRTCGQTFLSQNMDGTKTIQVCKTRGKYNVSEIQYFSEETQFALFMISKSVYNSVPVFIGQKYITIAEDEGTIQYKLKIFDEEDDLVQFELANSTYLMGNPVLHQDGVLLYTPCKDCFGKDVITVIIREIQTDPEITPAIIQETIAINVKDANDPPYMFITQYGQSILPEDPTEPVLVYLEQMNSFNEEKWSEEFSALVGAFDIEKEDLEIAHMEPVFGNIILSEMNFDMPVEENCSQILTKSSRPCGNFSMILPHDKHSMSWIYGTILYKQSMNTSGIDVVKLHVTDSMNGISSVLTIHFVLMESPCRNGGKCRNKSSSNYPCTSVHRAENFDLYFDCICTSGWSGIHCEDNIDECASSPCDAPLVCYDEVNGYICGCPKADPYCLLITWAVIPLVISLMVVIIIASIFIIKYIARKWSEKSENQKGPVQAFVDIILARKDIPYADDESAVIDTPEKKNPQEHSGEEDNNLRDDKIEAVDDISQVTVENSEFKEEVYSRMVDESDNIAPQDPSNSFIEALLTRKDIPYADAIGKQKASLETTKDWKTKEQFKKKN